MLSESITKARLVRPLLDEVGVSSISSICSALRVRFDEGAKTLVFPDPQVRNTKFLYLFACGELISLLYKQCKLPVGAHVAKPICLKLVRFLHNLDQLLDSPSIAQAEKTAARKEFARLAKCRGSAPRLPEKFLPAYRELVAIGKIMRQQRGDSSPLVASLVRLLETETLAAQSVVDLDKAAKVWSLTAQCMTAVIEGFGPIPPTLHLVAGHFGSIAGIADCIRDGDCPAAKNDPSFGRTETRFHVQQLFKIAPPQSLSACRTALHAVALKMDPWFHEILEKAYQKQRRQNYGQKGRGHSNDIRTPEGIYRGPFFLQERLLRDGDKIVLRKFRTLTPKHAQEVGEPTPHCEKTRHIGRETAFGRLLRQTRIDELPQLPVALREILRGRLLLIGIRPHPEFLVKQLPPELRSAYYTYGPGLINVALVSRRKDVEAQREAIAKFYEQYATSPWTTNLKYAVRLFYSIAVIGSGSLLQTAWPRRLPAGTDNRPGSPELD